MLNSVILMGRLTADPELRTTASNISMTRFTVAVERNFVDKQSGSRQTDFIDVIAWRGTADLVSRYFRKGQLICVQGSLQVRNYEDKDGNKRRAYEVVADNVHFADSKRSNDGGNDYSAPSYGSSESAQPVRSEEPASFSNGSDSDFVPIPDDDLPF